MNRRIKIMKTSLRHSGHAERSRGKCERFIFQIIILTLISLNTFAQTPQHYLTAVSKNFQKVKDYSADANVKVDIPFLRILPINVKVYFKQKDKFQVVSKSIAILPKQN